jgi:hypothetical protein
MPKTIKNEKTEKNDKNEKNIKNTNKSSVSSNISLTLDEILGTNSDNGNGNGNGNNNISNINNTKHQGNILQQGNTLQQGNSIKNTEKNNNSVNENNTSNTNNNNSNNNSNIDYILNNGIVKFDNKLQSSMFFVDYKSIHMFANILKTKLNMTIPKEIIDLHIINQIPKIIKEYTCNLKKRCKRVINTEYICLGRKLDNKQCTRKKHNGTDFCKSHLIKLSNGRFDEPTQAIVHNKRGRKRKVEFDPRQYDNEYITLWEDIIDGQKVLLDGNNNIYTYDLQAPQYIGKKYIDTKLDLSIYNKKKTVEKKSEESNDKTEASNDKPIVDKDKDKEIINKQVSNKQVSNKQVITDIIYPSEEIAVPIHTLIEEVKPIEKIKCSNKIKLKKN